MFEKVKKFVKKNRTEVIIVGLVIVGITATIVNAIITKKEGDTIEAEGLKILKVLENSDIYSFHYEKTDIKDMYDDKEFFDITHNEDGSMNDYGKSLI